MHWAVIGYFIVLQVSVWPLWSNGRRYQFSVLLWSAKGVGFGWRVRVGGKGVHWMHHWTPTIWRVVSKQLDTTGSIPAAQETSWQKKRPTQWVSGIEMKVKLCTHYTCVRWYGRILFHGNLYVHIKLPISQPQTRLLKNQTKHAILHHILFFYNVFTGLAVDYRIL